MEPHARLNQKLSRKLSGGLKVASSRYHLPPHSSDPVWASGVAPQGIQPTCYLDRYAAWAVWIAEHADRFDQSLMASAASPSPALAPLAHATATLGIAAETRVTPAQTKPDCPFPATISIVPPTPGGVSIGVPIDVPLTVVSKVIETQLVGRTFPENGSGPVDLTVKRATVAASGERLLISLLLSVKDRSKVFS